MAEEGGGLAHEVEVPNFDGPVAAGGGEHGVQINGAIADLPAGVLGNAFKLPRTQIGIGGMGGIEIFDLRHLISADYRTVLD